MADEFLSPRGWRVGSAIFIPKFITPVKEVEMVERLYQQKQRPKVHSMVSMIIDRLRALEFYST